MTPRSRVDADHSSSASEAVRTAPTAVGDASVKFDVALVGAIIDATITKRQRKKELNAQFDWLETAVAG